MTSNLDTRRLGGKRQKTEFTGCSPGPTQRMPVDDCAHTHAIADGDEDEVVTPLCLALALLGEGSKIDVVLYNDCGADVLLKHLTERDVHQVWKVLDELKPSRRRIRDPRCPHSHDGVLRVRRIDQFIDKLSQSGKHLAHGRRDEFMTGLNSGKIRDTYAPTTDTNIDCDYPSGVTSEPEHSSRATHPTPALSDPLNQPATDQVVDRDIDRWNGKV
jgi:hypothetical protein